MMYKQGDIVLIPIPFTDLSSAKKRPVLILSSDHYNNDTSDLIVAAITSNIDEKPLTVPNFIEKYKTYLNFEGDIKYLEYVTSPEPLLKLDRFV
ncbi:MAG: type II toxin-antitoxin system PemK/MazF family toxin [Oscillospiraceae bacterium]|nr:type II toxin-antitoxin system PemK/MazF family toxin [Oscillospiraceae bacterium]